MGDRSGMSISADGHSDETLNRDPLVLLLWQQYEYPFGINIVQFSFFFQMRCQVVPGAQRATRLSPSAVSLEPWSY